MHYLYIVAIILLNSLSCSTIEAQYTFLDAYPKFHEKSIKDRRFKHDLIKSLILALPDSLYTITQAGTSIEGREIYLIKVGAGDTKVLLWSQMHGNEPTATMAIFDIFNYLTSADDPARNTILKELTLYFIPLLNPDGAEKFERRNAIDIDLNRDALRLQSPESKILKQVRDEIDPRWGFNLHDQNHYSSAGKTENTASMSFLAPAFNEAKDWNQGRTEAMQLICKMNNILQKHIPDKIGRYSDEFEPRAFGDNIQKWGTNTILIETGGLENDPEKQYLRKLNYEALLQAFLSICSGSYKNYTLKDYNKIPYNGGVLHDLIIRNATIMRYDQSFLLDLAFRRTEVQDNQAKSFYLSSQIVDLGDLHNYYGYEEFDASGYRVEDAKVQERIYRNLQELSTVDMAALLQKGFTTFRLETMPSAEEVSKLPFQVIRAGRSLAQSTVELGQNPVLTFWKDQQMLAILVNGILYQLEETQDHQRIKNWFSEISSN